MPDSGKPKTCLSKLTSNDADAFLAEVDHPVRGGASASARTWVTVTGTLRRSLITTAALLPVLAGSNAFADHCPCQFSSPRLRNLTSEEPMPNYHAACLIPLDRAVDTLRRVSANFHVSGILNKTAKSWIGNLVSVNFNVVSKGEMRESHAFALKEVAQTRSALVLSKAAHDGDPTNPLLLEKMKIDQLYLMFEQAWADYTLCEIKH